MAERDIKLTSGGTALAALMLLAVVWAALAVTAIQLQLGWAAPLLVISGVAWLVLWFGFIVNGPNTARVVQLFGSYVGTLRDTGFFYGNPFYYRTRVSLRTRTFETGHTATEEVKDASTGKVIAPATHSRRPSKVNDRDGTPIEIAAVVVWKVVQPTEAVFEVDDYEEFVKVQSESALRNLASRYPYDGSDGERSLRANTADIGDELKRELHERFASAGVEVLEARISTLAYASEIASAMLQRQQAGAMIAARRLIVDAAVGMTEHALQELNARQVIDLDPERKAAMVANLMVVLCGHTQAQPVINTGTLHN
jgi:regulator of protease activity HflC (stomatin/prohibitin superfamily)